MNNKGSMTSYETLFQSLADDLGRPTAVTKLATRLATELTSLKEATDANKSALFTSQKDELFYRDRVRAIRAADITHYDGRLDHLAKALGELSAELTDFKQSFANFKDDTIKDINHLDERIDGGWSDRPLHTNEMTIKVDASSIKEALADAGIGEFESRLAALEKSAPRSPLSSRAVDWSRTPCLLIDRPPTTSSGTAVTADIGVSIYNNNDRPLGVLVASTKSSTTCIYFTPNGLRDLASYAVSLADHLEGQ